MKSKLLLPFETETL